MVSREVCARNVAVVDDATKLRLPGGRRLGYAECGDPNGRALVYLHGFPGSRLAGRVLDETARARGVRVLAPERPGLGVSSPQSDRTLLDTARDVRALAEALQIGPFAVLGESGGGPYALACAHELADCLDSVAVVCGLGPIGCPGATDGIALKERIGYAVATRAPLLACHTLVPVAAWARRRPRQFLRVTRWQLGEADREVLNGPLGDLVAADFAEAFRQGSRGVAQDLALLFPSSRLRVYEQHGHFSLLARSALDILEGTLVLRETVPAFPPRSDSRPPGTPRLPMPCLRRRRHRFGAAALFSYCRRV